MYQVRGHIKYKPTFVSCNQRMSTIGLVRWCGGVWGPSSLRRQTLPSPKLVEFKMSERELPITTAQRVVIKFLTNENVGPNEIWCRLRAQYGESTLSKTQVKFWHKEFCGV